MSTVQFRTSGTGLWSSTKTTVTITNMEVSATDYQFDNGDTKYPDFGELRVYFDDTWDLDRDGLSGRQFSIRPGREGQCASRWPE